MEAKPLGRVAHPSRGDSKVCEELVLCPTCHESNPDSNRFCGHCGTVLSAKYTPARRSGDQLPQELIEFDRKIPLIAEPGSDRRSNVPENIREKVQEVLERDRSREAGREREVEAQREAREVEISRDKERELERNRVTVPAEEEVERPVQLPSGFLGLNNIEPPREAERVAAATHSRAEEEPAARTSNNTFWSVEEESAPAPTGVVGPSFLGLSDSLEDVEQDEPESHTRRNVALVVLLLLIGLGATQWKAIRDQGLPFVKNGTQQVLLKVKGKQAQPATDDSSSNTNSNGGPNMEVGPLNENLKKQQEAAKSASGTPPTPNADTSNPAMNNAAPTNTAAAASSSTTSSDSSKPNDNTNARADSNPAANAAATPATTGGAVGAAIPDGAATSKADESSTGEPAKPVAKEIEKPTVSNASARNRRKPSGADRPQISDEPTQAGNVEYERALVTSDPGVQRSLLWQAVKKGNSDASVKLAELYIAGRGVEKSCDQAMVLLRSASAHSSARARGKLGAMYATGECVSQDRVQAYHWMSMALEANPNSDWTARYRDNLWSQMTAAEKMRAGRDR